MLFVVACRMLLFIVHYYHLLASLVVSSLPSSHIPTTHSPFVVVIRHLLLPLVVIHRSFWFLNYSWHFPLHLLGCANGGVWNI